MVDGINLRADIPVEEQIQSAVRREQQEYVDTFFGEGFELAFDLEDSEDRINRHFRDIRPNTPPDPLSPFQCRIGVSTFYVPPIAINVNTQFKAGALATGALRRQNSPKFNTGNKETLISMTLYFPNFAEIYGSNVESLNTSIHFEDSSDEEIDRVMSSLRGLIAQFKYAPFLPVRNAYLNQVHDITAVVMKNLSIANVPGFPGVIAATLEMYKFNHKVYLPMVEDFNSAIHWGRYRLYCGRAMVRTANEDKGLNIWEDGDTIANSKIRTGEVGSPIGSPGEILSRYGFDYADYGESLSLAGPQAIDVREFDFFYPFFVPSGISTAELEGLISETAQEVEAEDWWDSVVSFLGFNDTNTDVFVDYQTIKDMKLNEDDDDKVSEGYVLDGEEYQTLLLFFQQTNTLLEEMDASAREAYYQKRRRELGYSEGSEAAANLRQEVIATWMYVIDTKYRENVGFAKLISDDDRRRRNVNIQEWLVPMQQLYLDERYVHIQDISIRMGNKISRMQLQMQDEPTHQHLGGEDTVISLSIIVTGGDTKAIGDLRDPEGTAENELIKLRTMFDTVSGIARLAHGHGTMGFLGVKNAMTDLIGVKHVVPLSFDVRTIPNMPHSYSVTVEVVDFDILQQQREALDPTQQAYLAEQFGKHNPFLRAKQNFSLFSAYPDFPLDVRDDENKVVGYLNPSFYFRTFETMPERYMESDVKTPVTYNVGTNPDGTAQQIISYDDASFAVNEKDENGKIPRSKIVDMDYVPSNVTLDSSLTPANRYQNPYSRGGIAGHVEDMAKDMAYRNKDGNMVRAFPTYMLWVIDEAGQAAGIKLFDNFYGLQSVIDMSLVRSEEIMADTLMLRISNLYSNLSTSFQDYLDEDSTGARLVNRTTTQRLRLNTGVGGYILDVDSINVKPGLRIHLRMGYSSDPRKLETVFNGKVTEVHQGEIMTLVCQSDSVELGALVNSTNKKGHSGKVDGSFDNLYLSEPRDLMVALLSNGATAAKRVIAHATKGEIFSENRYGIRHFGMMLYESTVEEQAKSAARNTVASSMMVNHRTSKLAEDDVDTIDVLEDGARVRSRLIANLAARRDTEIFKRNIYPGNSMGVGQFLGGDFGDIALGSAAGVVEGGGINPDGTFRTDPISGRPERQQVQAEEVEERSLSLGGFLVTNILGGPGIALRALGLLNDDVGDVTENVEELLGLRRTSSDQDIIPEVSFRAQTYMKTVWDLFKVCAAMMPDYIVAVRPFEERSTVFYGKPHWMYTSGVVPITKGRELGKVPNVEDPDSILGDLAEEINSWKDKDPSAAMQDAIVRAARYDSSIAKGIDPNATLVGVDIPGDRKSVLSLPTKRNGVPLPQKETRVAEEMHLPLSGDLSEDIQYHKQIELPGNKKHPYYMDRLGGLRGGEPGFSVGNQERGTPGEPAGGVYAKDRYPTMEEAALSEQFYVVQRWTNKAGEEKGWWNTWGRARILVLNKENGRACVCTPLDFGPSSDLVASGRGAGISPDVFEILGRPQDKTCIFRVVGDDVELGPVNFTKEDPVFAVHEQTPDWYQRMVENQGLPSGQDLVERGYRAFRSTENIENIAVNFDATGTIYIDEEGNFIKPEDDEIFLPSSLYSEFRTEAQARKVWDFLVTEYPTDRMDGESFLRVIVGGEIPNGNHGQTMINVVSRLNPGRDEEFIRTWLRYSDFRDQVLRYENAVISDNETVQENDPASQGAAPDAGEIGNVLLQALIIDDRYDGIYEFPKEGSRANDSPEARAVREVEAANKLIKDTDIPYEESRAYVLNDNFLRMLWQDPYSRGWVVRALDQDAFIDVDSPSFNTEYRYAPLDAIFQDVYSNEEKFLEITDSTRNIMRQDNDLARNDGGVFASVGGRVMDIANTAMSALRSFADGALGLFRTLLMDQFNSVADSFHGEAASNVLNVSLNDSLYYAEGVDEKGNIYDAIRYYADNPFTREYAEPVFEIREPFQRIHHIGSFQHILDNIIMESTTNVATVITASSNDDQPVTVHFDKNAPVEDQVEKTVDTGLFLSEEGFFSRIFNPINTLRDFITTFNPLDSRPDSNFASGISDNKLAERIAAAHLKESLKDIYQGEIIILGDPSIRPYDLVYLADSYLKIYGIVEVEQVVHHFTPDAGFITTITPNAVVTVKDPARFSVIATTAKKNAIHTVRERIRKSYEIKIDGNSDIPFETEETEDRLKRAASAEIVGTTQFIGGATSVVKSLIPNAIFELEKTERELEQESPDTINFGAIPRVFIGPRTLAMWGTNLWERVRDNLLDQNACHIHYLNKRGRPMDAGLNFADGVAVGQMATRDIVLAGIDIASSNITTGVDGDSRINIGDVIPQLQYSEITGVSEASRKLSRFEDEQNRRLRTLSGRTGDRADPQTIRVYLLEVTDITDADTFRVDTIGEFKEGSLDTGAASIGPRIRMVGVDAPEDPFKSYNDEQRAEATARANRFGAEATAYTQRVMPVGTRFAFRTYGTNEVDQFDRTLGNVFHNYPVTLSGQDRQEEFMLRTAYKVPIVPWDSFLPDGQAATFDYQLVLSGYAKVYTSDLERNMPGVEGGRGL